MMIKREKMKENKLKETILEVRNLRFSYEEKQVLKDMNLEIKKGEFVALIGANGAGKSTFFKLLLSKEKANSGEIKLFGDDIRSEKHHREIAYISQNAISAYRDFPTTVEEVLKVHLRYLNLKKNLKEVLAEIGLAAHGKHRLKELSGGQLQRLALSLALLKNAELIFLDEPTSGIDKDFSKELYEFLKKLSVRGKTVLMATHHLSDALPYLDKVSCIEHGSCRILNEVQIEREVRKNV